MLVSNILLEYDCATNGVPLLAAHLFSCRIWTYICTWYHMVLPHVSIRVTISMSWITSWSEFDIVVVVS